MSYQKTVLIIALILLIFASGSIYYTLKKNEDENWNATKSKCPDYWSFNSDLNQCEKDGQIFMLDNKSDCDRYHWAINSDPVISWDGITYGTSLSCPLPVVN